LLPGAKAQFRKEEGGDLFAVLFLIMKNDHLLIYSDRLRAHIRKLEGAN
jgi:hypothetical protein